jgi:hypothetical protein
MNTPLEYSSLKCYNFKDMTKDEIIAKYEAVLTQRETQIRDLSLEIGNINLQLTNTMERCKDFEYENKILLEKLTRKIELLEQNERNLELMFMRLQTKEQDCDDLNTKVKYLMKTNSLEKEREIKINSEKVINEKKEKVEEKKEEKIESKSLSKIKALKERKKKQKEESENKEKEEPKEEETSP